MMTPSGQCLYHVGDCRQGIFEEPIQVVAMEDWSHPQWPCPTHSVCPLIYPEVQTEMSWVGMILTLATLWMYPERRFLVQIWFVLDTWQWHRLENVG